MRSSWILKRTAGKNGRVLGGHYIRLKHVTDVDSTKRGSKKGSLYGEKSIFYELNKRKARVRTRNCDCTRSQAVSVVAYVSRTAGVFFFVHRNDRGPSNIMRLAMSFVSCPSQVTLVINDLVFFIITCPEHHSSK